MDHFANRNRLKLRLGILLFIAACLVRRVHADYLGPNRTYVVTTYETCDYGIWAKPGNCTDSSGNPSDCTIGDWECDPGDPPDDGAYYYALGTTVVERSTTHTDPEATISGTIHCPSQGENGWCIAPCALSLSAEEPVGGASILLIEGTQNGEPFACTASACTVNLTEGENSFTYWALSSYGDSTRMGQNSQRQDTRPPVIDASLNGSLGENGWFVTEPVLTVAVNDPIPGSGVASGAGTDGATVFSIAAPYRITEGVHPITLSVKDHAGLTTTLEDTVSVDLTAPTLSGNYSLPVRNGYYKGTISFYGSASDAMSGITEIEIAPDGEAWRSVGIGADGNWRYDWNSLEHADGSVTPQLLARDRAGNETILTLPPLTIDNQPPTLTGDDIRMEHAGFNHGLLAFSGTATDSQSGVERLEFAPDGSTFHPLNLDAQGRWTFNWDSREHADGEVTPVLKAMDIAGNESAISLREYHLDNSPPELTAREILREAGGYNHGNIPFSGTAYDRRAGIARLEFAPDGVRFRTISADENQRWAFTWESWERDDGGVVPVLRAVDFLGNAAEIRLREFQLDNSAPELFLTSAWYIWEKGHVYVKDERAGIQGIGLSVRDDQKRWAAREYGYERNPLDIDFKWDRRFGDENRTIAPVGSYEVLLEACDLVGNCTDVTGRIYVPAQNDAPPLTRTSWAGIPLPTQTRTATAVASATQQAAGTIFPTSATATIPFPTATRPAAVIVPTRPPTRTPRPTATPGKYVFLGNIPKNPNPAPTPDPLPVDPNLLTGMAAVTAAASATATALFMRRKREEELRRIADESRAEAEARARAANRQRIITNLQNQERMANPDKYRNISTDQIPFDERKVSQNESFFAAIKAGLITPIRKALREKDILYSLKKFFIPSVKPKRLALVNTKNKRQETAQSDYFKELTDFINKEMLAGRFSCRETADGSNPALLSFSNVQMAIFISQLFQSESGLEFLRDIHLNNANIVILDNDNEIFRCGNTSGKPITVRTQNFDDIDPVGYANYPVIDLYTFGKTESKKINNGWCADILINIEAMKNRDADNKIDWDKAKSTLYHEIQHGLDYVSFMGEAEEHINQLEEINKYKLLVNFWDNKHLFEKTISERYGLYTRSEWNSFTREERLAENLTIDQIYEPTTELSEEQINRVLNQEGYWNYFQSEIRGILLTDFSILPASVKFEYSTMPAFKISIKEGIMK